MEMLAGAAAGLVYDIAYGKSPGSSSEQNGTHVGPGGTVPREVPVIYTRINRSFGGMKKGDYISQCPPGYELHRKKDGKLVCRRKKK